MCQCIAHLPYFPALTSAVLKSSSIQVCLFVMSINLISLVATVVREVAVLASQKIPLLLAWVVICCSLRIATSGRNTAGNRNSLCCLTSSSLLHSLFANVFRTFLAKCHFLAGHPSRAWWSIMLGNPGFCNRVISAGVGGQLSSPLRIVRMESQTTLMLRPVHWRKCSVKEVVEVHFSIFHRSSSCAS